MISLQVLGTISRPHGLAGTLKVNIHAAGAMPLSENEPVFIQLQGGPVPFFIQECVATAHNVWHVKLDEVDTVEAANRFVAKELLVEEHLLQGAISQATDALIGFSVTDHEKGAIGVVAGILETAQHPVLEIAHNEKLILIPWVEAIVKEIDEEAQTIAVEAPDGLIDLYMNG